MPPLSPSKVDASGRLIPDSERIPIDHLRGLFGERTEEVLRTLKREIAKKKRGEKSELLDTLIVYSWPGDIFPDFTQDPAELEGVDHG